jgi:hypothetical protein
VHLPLPALTLLSGQAVTNVNKTIASAVSEEVALRASWEIVDGAQWEWHAPISLQRVKLGICKMEENEEVRYELFDFNSSTPRNVTFAVHGSELLVWVNGHPLARSPKKDITYDSAKNKWYPCAKLQEKGNTVIFSPFTTTPLSDVSLLNPFGKVDLTEPVEAEAVPVVPETPKISKLTQISKDKFLIQWENNAVRVFERN